MSDLDPDLGVIARVLDPWACQIAVVAIAGVLGQDEVWSPSQIEDVGAIINDLLKETAVPDPLDSSTTEFWRAVLDS